MIVVNRRLPRSSPTVSNRRAVRPETSSTPRKKQLEDVDERVRLSTAVGVADDERALLEDEVDLSESKIAALYPRLSRRRALGGGSGSARSADSSAW
jgi:hypothetical protein